MKKKLLALAMAATMVISLAGCGKKIEGKYTAKIDITDSIEEALNSYLSENDLPDINFKGSVTYTLELELEDGEYSIEADTKSTEKSFIKYMETNLDTIFETVAKESYGESLDEYLESRGYSSIYEAMGYDSAEDYIKAELGSDWKVEEFEESGDYKIDGDEITLEDCGDDDLELTYEDGELKGKIELSELGLDIDEKVKVTFKTGEDEEDDED